MKDHLLLKSAVFIRILAGLTLISAAVAATGWTQAPALAQESGQSQGDPSSAADPQAKPGQDANSDKDKKAPPVDSASGLNLHDPSLRPHVILRTTLGNIELELDGARAPRNVLNFIRYVEQGFYDGKIFHYVRPHEVIASGLFDETMTPHPPGLHPAVRSEARNGLLNDRGTIAAVSLAGPDSANAPFLINLKSNLIQDSRGQRLGFTVFGKVVEGMDVADLIGQLELVQHPSYPTKENVPTTPKIPVVIKKAKVTSEFNREALQEAADRMNEDDERREYVEKEKLAKLIHAYVEAKEKETGKKFHTVEGGVLVLEINEGKGPLPTPDSIVTLDYKGELLTGEIFDSTILRGEPMHIYLKDLMPGMRFGVRDMRLGGKRLLVVPSDLAFGPIGQMPRIPPNATLLFEIEMVGIAGPDLPDPQKNPPGKPVEPPKEGGDKPSGGF